MMKAVELREDFIKYFRENKHKLLKPSKVFNDDPSLLFVNAGMNQLKNIFLDLASDKDRNEDYKRLCNSQICIRAGGKHNDLDDVGLDSYHLTSFEMLGNWSIDCYRKEEAIFLAFNYLTERLKLNKMKIYITYFGGDSIQNLQSDDETREIWKKYVPEERIIKGNFKDNFWMMADDGPCGMCTEIHYDLSDEDRIVPEIVNKSDPTLIEIWNIVFIEYKHELDGSYNKLNRFYVDTGMGMERLCMVLQKKKTIYQTDVFHYLMGYAQAMTNCSESYSDYYENTYDIKYNRDCAYRIFCDHFRTIIVAIFDGAKFDVSGRGFILRKIFRRLLTYLYLYLNNYTIEHLISKPIVKGIIADVLNYFLYRKHDYNKIHEDLINEERLFLNILYNSQRKFNTLNNNISFDETIDNVHSIAEKLRHDGIPELIIKNINIIKIKNINT